MPPTDNREVTITSRPGALHFSYSPGTDTNSYALVKGLEDQGTKIDEINWNFCG